MSTYFPYTGYTCIVSMLLGGKGGWAEGVMDKGFVRPTLLNLAIIDFVYHLIWAKL